MSIKRIVPKKVKRLIRHIIPVRSIDNKPMIYNYEIRITETTRLEGLRIIVTGATGAIGSAICLKCLTEGAIVGVSGRNTEKVKSLVEKFNNMGITKGRIIPLIMDVTDEKSVNEAIKHFISITGGLDALVNNAGGSARGKSKCVYEQDIAIIDEVINLNLRGCILCSQIASKEMIKHNKGKIISMASVIGMQGKEKMSDYAAAKAGIIGFTKSLALELSEYRILVNCISPGMVNQTPFDAGLPEKKTNGNCLNRFGYTDEVAKLVAFLLSDDANYITGQNIVIDGGRTLGLYGDR